MSQPYTPNFHDSKIHQNVEIRNTVNFRDKIFVITQRFCYFNKMCSSTRIVSKREMPRVEIQSCIRECFMFLWQLWSFLQAYLFIQSSFVHFCQY